MRYTFTRLAPALVLFLLAFTHSEKGKQTYVSSFENVLGTSFDLKVVANNETIADAAENVALSEIDRLSSILSSYDANSEFSRWQQTQNEAIRVSPELMEVMQLFDLWKTKTNQALNPAAAGVITLWKQAETSGRIPAEADIRQTLSSVQQQAWKLNPDQGTAIHLSKTPLVMNSFVKSYIIEKAAEKVMSIDGISGVLVNIGGDMVVKGSLNEKVLIEDPMQQADNTTLSHTLKLQEKAIATSGNYKRGFSVNGQWFSHIVDPRTGMPAAEVVAATVIADRATDAGALATAFNILHPDQSAILAAESGAAYQLILKDGRVLESKNWKAFEEQSNVGSTSKDTRLNKSKEWDKSYELAINLELMRFEGRFRRPFVAVWVEDSKHNTVRTLALWFNKPRWLPDLKEWYRKNNGKYSSGPQDIYSISSATRPAGTYTLKWDGKNDEGKYVEAGNYTVFIEAAREHGTYQLMKQEITCKDKSQTITIPGNAEVSSASLEYRKTATNK